MLTTEGKNQIRRYLAGYVPAIAQTVVYGIGNTAESPSDIALDLEVARAPITHTYYDFATNKLVYKAGVPDDYTGKIYEVGLYSLLNDPTSGEYGSRLITTFDSDSEDWVDLSDVASGFGSVSTRVGIDSLYHNPTSAATMTSTLKNIDLDFSGNSAADKFTFALNVATTAPSNITVRFMTDASNYYSYSLATAVGYKLIKATKGSASVTGAPNWANITEIRIITTAAAGTANVEFDAIRIEDVDSVSLDYILVARKVLAVPFTKTDGMSQDTEFSLDVVL
jgi:hypothetical protein